MAKQEIFKKLLIKPSPMKQLLSRIDQMKDRLVKGNLFANLSNESVAPDFRLSFTPSMLYYLMGFKDVLEALAVKKPKTELDKMINAYCMEDAEHWRWYLSDLQKLGYSLDSWGKTIPQFCNTVWSKETKINRATIFTLIKYAYATNDPLVKLILIQIFEATGVLFIGHTRKAAIAMGKDEDLFYFGRVHYEEEFGHTVQSTDLLKYEIAHESKQIALNAIEDLEKCYYQLFEMWYNNTGKFSTNDKN